MKRMKNEDFEEEYSLHNNRRRVVSKLIIQMKKILDSDWLRAVQFKCNTSANYTSLFWIMILNFVGH